MKRIRQNFELEQGMEKKILIVEDNPVNAVQLSDQLRKRGFITEVCGSGEECLELLEVNRYALVLLDIMMPGISGLEVLPLLRKKFQPVELPVIMVTIVDDDRKIVEALGLGANDYLVKPVKIEVAVARINSQLNASAYHLRNLDLQRLEATKAMVITYNHEINNPLTVAMTEVAVARKRGDAVNLDRIYESLEKITGIVKKIRELTEGEVEIKDYLGGKMVKLQ
ncbi:MAG: response regulator [Proteobacteria bacterium]|nr:response regulator [Pseudomonadota bacterium]MBU1736814.1 response regulator [Pseudomonadota bacterium]